MADVSISYKNTEIATMNATGVKTLLTGDCFCEDDITVTYTKPAAPPPTLQTKSATYTPTTSQQTASITADAGYDGLDEVNVTVDAMPSGSATTPATTITANPSISVSSDGLITASVSASQSVTPTVSAGYVSSGTAGTVSVSGSNTSQLTVYNGAHHQPTPANYTVTVLLTNPIHSSSFDVCEIYEQYSISDPDYSVNPIQTIDSATGNATVSILTSSYGLRIQCKGSSSYIYAATITCTGGVSYSIHDSDTLICAVTADGTITIDGVDYDD